MTVHEQKHTFKTSDQSVVSFSGGQWGLLEVGTTWGHPGEATNLDPVEHQLVPQTVVTDNPTPELRLLSPHSVVKQSPSQRGVHRTQDLKRNKQTQAKVLHSRTPSFFHLCHFCPHLVLLSQRQIPKFSSSTTRV